MRRGKWTELISCDGGERGRKRGGGEDALQYVFIDMEAMMERSPPPGGHNVHNQRKRGCFVDVLVN